MLVLAGSPLLTGTLSFAVIALSVLVVGLVLHRSRTIPTRTPEQHLDRLFMRFRDPVRYKLTQVREWFE